MLALREIPAILAFAPARWAAVGVSRLRGHRSAYFQCDPIYNMTIGEHDAKIASAPLMFSISFCIPFCMPSSRKKLTSTRISPLSRKGWLCTFRIHVKQAYVRACHAASPILANTNRTEPARPRSFLAPSSASEKDSLLPRTHLWGQPLETWLPPQRMRRNLLPQLQTKNITDHIFIAEILSHKGPWAQ